MQDSILAACLHELWFLAASHEFDLRAVHLSSAANRLDDLLSPWHLNRKFQEEFHAKTASCSMQDVTVPSSYFMWLIACSFLHRSRFVTAITRSQEISHLTDWVT